ncbi:MAG: class I SAM-dependent methyltransferase [Flavobacteriales bacterium]
MSEIQNIKNRYKNRNDSGADRLMFSIFSKALKAEREKFYLKYLNAEFKDLSKIKVLEIGAGGGGNIYFFKSIGVESQNIFANELLPERLTELRRTHHDINIIEGDALEISENLEFDLVFQSTVFTSILDNRFKQKLAKKMISLTKESGIILWYDFQFNNPKNKDVKGVRLKEVRKLFPNGLIIKSKRVTLAPPIGRRVGKLYNFINSVFPFLRTHLIVVIKK